MSGGFRPSGPEARQRAAERRAEEREASRADVTARLIEKYRTEPDRAYAEEFWGEVLRQRGIETAGLIEEA